MLPVCSSRSFTRLATFFATQSAATSSAHSFRFGLPDAEGDDAPAVERADLVANEPRLRLEERNHLASGEINHFIGGTGRHVVQSNSEMAHEGGLLIGGFQSQPP